MRAVGMPEIIIVFVLLFVVGLPFLFYRMGYNRGYTKGLEKLLEQRNSSDRGVQ